MTENTSFFSPGDWALRGPKWNANDVLSGWNENQIRYLEDWLLDSLPEVYGLQVTSIDTGETAWRVFYNYEKVNGVIASGSDYFIGRLLENKLEDFMIV